MYPTSRQATSGTECSTTQIYLCGKIIMFFINLNPYSLVWVFFVFFCHNQGKDDIFLQLEKNHIWAAFAFKQELSNPGRRPLLAH